jgi:hypothetical protein
MKLVHYDLQIELDDSWWAEAGMEGFVPKTRTYRVYDKRVNGQKLYEIRIDEIKPVERKPGVAIFRNKKDVIRILRGFATGSTIPPIEIGFEPSDSKYRYRLVDGTHRLYCSLAAGFSHVPAIEGWEPEDRTSYSKLETRN